jgi:hypothetical protein
VNDRLHSQPDITSDCPDIEDQFEAYAIGALDSFDRGLVEHHLRWCPRCRAIAEEWNAVASHLPLASPPVDAPAPELKRALMDRVRGQEKAPRPASGHEQRPSSSSTNSQLPPRWQRMLSVGLIAPLALALVVMGAWANSMRIDLNEREDDLTDQVELNQALLSGNQVQLYTVVQNCPTCQGSGQLGVSASDDMGMMVGWNFDPKQQHDVWQVNADGHRKRVCQLHVDPEGGVMQMFHLPEAPSDYADVYITDEDGVLIYLTHLGDDQNATDPSAASVS